MKKVLLSMIPLFSGFFVGYWIVIFAGMSYPSMELFKWVVSVFNAHGLSFLLPFAFAMIHLLHMMIVSIPLIAVSGILLTKTVSLKPLTIGWTSSIGIVFFAVLLGTFNVLEMIIEISLLFSLNILFVLKASKFKSIRRES